ncbi:MAG: histone deacetylase [Anaerolineales bacterium]
MHPLAFFYPVGHAGHAQPGHAERPERVETIRRVLEVAGLWDQALQIQPEIIPGPVLAAIHTPGMLETARINSQHETNIDLDTYLTQSSWPLALTAAGGTAALARAVWRGEAQAGFALARPPGHHATRSHSMGFCLLNNIALAAEILLQQEGAQRLAIVDMDVHHGNGTQDIFYERGEVMFISSHQVPLYPGSGQLNERGLGKGFGKIVNLPLPPQSGNRAFAMAYQEIIPSLLTRFQPEMVLVSFGFDSHWKDPLANLLVSARAYGEAVQSLRTWAQANCQGRIALVLEGGYDLEAAGACALAAAQGMLAEKISDDLGPSRQRESDDWVKVLERVKQIWEL